MPARASVEFLVERFDHGVDFGTVTSADEYIRSAGGDCAGTRQADAFCRSGHYGGFACQLNAQILSSKLRGYASLMQKREESSGAQFGAGQSSARSREDFLFFHL